MLTQKHQRGVYYRGNILFNIVPSITKGFKHDIRIFKPVTKDSVTF